MRFLPLLLSVAWARLPVPEVVPPTLTSLGAPVVLGVALSPDRKTQLRWTSVAVASPSWTAPVPHPPRFVRYSVDGAQVAVVVREPDADYRLLVLDAANGKLLQDHPFALQAPAIERGIQPPAWPTALVATPAGFRVINAYGAFAVDGKGSRSVPGPSGNVYGAPDGSLWQPSGPKLNRVGGPSTALPCNPSFVAVDPALDRVAIECAPRNKPAQLHLLTLSSGKVLRTHPASGSVSSMVIMDAATVVATHTRPASIATYKETVAREAQAGTWHEIHVDGAVALGVGSGGEVQLFDTASQEVLCDHQKLGFAALSGGFAGDELWFLAYTPGVFNQLDLVRVSRAKCEEIGRTSIPLGKTTNLLPKWVPQRRAFVLNALVGSDYGLIALPVADHQPQWLAKKRTPRFQVAEDGRVGWVDYVGCGVLDKAIRDVGKCDYLALPPKRTLSYGYKRGWGDPKPLFDTMQPGHAQTVGDVLYLASRETLHRIEGGKITHAWRFSTHVPTFVRLDDTRLLFGGGPTGWQTL